MKHWFILAGYACLSLSLYAQEIQAGLYRPAAESLVMEYAPAALDQRLPLKTKLHLYGRGFHAGKGALEFAILGDDKELHRGKLEIDAPGEVFERVVELQEPLKNADQLAWTLRMETETWSGKTSLRWSRFSGKLEYVDRRSRPSYISLFPVTFKGGEFQIPVREDGSFDVQVPSRIYAVANVNGAGYAFDSMERWAWNFDLTRDREELFKLGRTELYGMHAFCLLAPTSTVFVVFRPSALTRILQHAPLRGAKPKDEATMTSIVEHLKKNPLAIAPELLKENVKVRLNGEAYPISDLSRVVETAGQGVNQVIYILQFIPPQRPERGIRHEIVVEVESWDVLNGKLIKDFGQGSVGLYLE